MTILQPINDLIEHTQAMAEALEGVRQEATAEEWELFNSNKHLSQLLMRCGDLENLINN